MDILIKSCISFLLILLFLSSHSHCLIKTEAQREEPQQNATHTVHVTSLLPDTDSCNPSTTGSRRGNSLEVRHRHGGCSPLKTENEKLRRPSHEEILSQDEARVASIKQRLKPKMEMANLDRTHGIKQQKAHGIKQQKAVELPAKSGSTIGSGNFIVTVGLGTPKKDLSLIFDTGSDFTWTQCEPCKKSCYEQKEAVFDPSASSTYSNVSCSSALCSDVRSATSTAPRCSSSTCVYGIQYGDSSFSIGFLARDTLTLGSYGAVPDFYFGCGEDNEGLFGGSAGLIGLGRNKLSAVSQAASKYGNCFSYCLPSKSSSTGHLTFGTEATHAKSMTYTSLLSSSQGPSFYFIELQGISVGGTKLSISPTVFSAGGTLIDSGTVITRLPPDAYVALQLAFDKVMSTYPKAPSLSILDTCYDFSSYTTIKVPKVSLFFSGGATLDLGIPGILYVSKLTQVCLAFAGNEDESDVGILGNIQQLTFDVVYDVSAGRLGFGPAGCL